MPNPPNDLADYLGYLERHGRLLWVADAPWCLDGRKLVPAAPPHRSTPVPMPLVKEAMRRSGALVALWNDAWDTPPGPWWWVCCDDHQYGFESLKSKRRNAVRRGLRRCEVRRVSAADLAEHGYEVYAAAFERYDASIAPVPRERFQKGALDDARFPCREGWGVFVEGRLAAFARCIIAGDAVLVSQVRALPSLLKSNPNEALWFTLTQHYLNERRMAYVSDGWRVLGHETNVQDFLESMGYRRIYCPLRMVTHPLLGLALRCRADWWARLLRLSRWAPALSAHIAAAARARDIAGECARQPPTPHAD